MWLRATNEHDEYAAPDIETLDTRFPLSNSQGEATGHSTKLPNTAAKYTRKGYAVVVRG